MVRNRAQEAAMTERKQEDSMMMGGQGFRGRFMQARVILRKKPDEF
jgi:hypothetical protein